MSFKAASEHRDDVASVAAASSSIAIRSATLRGERWRRATCLQILCEGVRADWMCKWTLLQQLQVSCEC